MKNQSRLGRSRNDLKQIPGNPFGNAFNHGIEKLQNLLNTGKASNRLRFWGKPGNGWGEFDFAYKNAEGTAFDGYRICFHYEGTVITESRLYFLFNDGQRWTAPVDASENGDPKGPSAKGTETSSEASGAENKAPTTKKGAAVRLPGKSAASTTTATPKKGGLRIGK